VIPAGADEMATSSSNKKNPVSFSRGRNFSIRFAAFAVMLLSLFMPARVGAQVVGATLNGTITDESGAVIAKANVTVTNSATGVARTATTNDAGIYVVPDLQPGDYEISSSAAGFQTVSTKLTLTVGAQQTQNLTLTIGTSAQKIEVTAEAPTINLVESTLGGLNDENQIQQLPLNGRSWSDLANLAPGVYTVRNVAAITTRDRESRGYGAEVAISGARPQQNNYRLDGISINDPQNGAPGSILGGNLGVDAISEFSVLTTNYSTEYGRASGGIINATTKSGTNAFHGSAYEFLRNSALDAANYFDVQKPPFRRNQFGASAGGPIKKNKMFIFGDYEGLRQTLNITQNSFVPSVNARSGILSTGNVTVDPQIAKFLTAFYPLPNAPGPNPDIGSFIFGRPQIVPENYFIIRSDQIMSNKDTLHETYMFDWAKTSEVDEFRNKNVISETHNQLLVLDWSHSFSSAFLNDARFGLHREFVGGPASATALNPAAKDMSFGTVPGDSAAQIVVPGLTNFTGGLSATAPVLDPWTSWQGYDDAFYTTGIHSLKFGANIEWMKDNRLSTPRPGGQWNFASLPAFLTNVPLNLSADAPGATRPRGQRQTYVGMYAQDDMRVRPNLTINVGLRYEPWTVPSEVHGQMVTLLTPSSPAPAGMKIGNPLYANNTLFNFEPRLGFAWDPFKSGKTSIRAGFGFYDQPPLNIFFGNPEENSPPFAQSVNTSSLTQGDFPTLGYLKAVPGSLTSERVAFVQQHPGRSYVMQYNLSVQRQLSTNLTILVGYVGSHGVRGITNDDDADIVQPIVSPVGYLWPCEPFSAITGCGGIGSGTRINTTIAREPFTLFRNSALYNGLQVQVTKRMSYGLQAQGSFTWQRSIDTASGNLASDQFINGISSEFVFNSRLQRAIADFDVPKVLTLNFLWAVPTAKSLPGFANTILGGWQLGTIFTASNGVPFTPVMAGDPLGLDSTDPWAFPDRVRGPGCQSLVNPGNVQNYLKVQCFTVPPAVVYNGVHYIRLGNGGRNEVYGPGLVDFDFSIVKNTPVKRISETFNVQFRAEAFNILNRPNFNTPVYNGQNAILDPTIAGIGIVPANALTDVISLDPIDSTATTSRQLQFALKVIW
jgi:hypothetical protein